MGILQRRKVELTQRIIFCVGPDRCGKTEISKALSESIGVPRFKASSEHETFLKHQERFVDQLRSLEPRMVDFLRQTGHSVIFDRGYPCECAYSQVLNRETDWKVLSYVDSAMADMGARVIICRRSSYKGIVDDIDPSLEENRLQQLDNAYVDFSRWTKCKTLLLNVDDENLEREIREIQEWLNEK